MAHRIPISKEKLEVLRKEIKPITEGFDLVSDHVIITDENANVLYANKAVEEKTGFSQSEILHKTPGDLWGGKMPPEFYRDMWHKIKDLKQAFSGEVQNIRKDGTHYWQLLQIFPVLGTDGNPRFFIGIEPDITARKVAEANRNIRTKEMDILTKFMSSEDFGLNELKNKIELLKERLRVV